MSSSNNIEILYGFCSCRRNQYAVTIPLAQKHVASVYLENTPDIRTLSPFPSSHRPLLWILTCLPPTDTTGRTQVTPITAYLRVPLTWFSSFDNGQNCRRAFSPSNNPHVRHTFCGHCGTPLRFWTEEPLNSDAREWISVTVGSLGEREQELLGELDLLPEAAEKPQRPSHVEEPPSGGVAQPEEEEADEEIVRSPEALERQQVQVRQHQQEQRQRQQQQQSSMMHPMMSDMMTPFSSSSLFSNPGWSLVHPPQDSFFDDPMPGFGSHGIPWFEDMLGGSRMSRTPRAHHGRVVRDEHGAQPTGNGNVQWEVREWVDDNGGRTASSSQTMRMSGGTGTSFMSSSSSSGGFSRKQRRTGGW